jgi:membrane protease YdiL (CAAX protease family)
MTDLALRPMAISAKRAYTETLLVFLAFFGAGVMGAVFYLVVNQPKQPNEGWSAYLPAAFEVLAEAGLAVAVVLLLLNRRGLGRRDIGLSFTRPDGSRLAWGSSIRVVALAELGLIVGSVVTGAFGGKYPGLNSSADYLVYMSASSFNAGIVEELVVLAFVVTTLRQARRPWWEVGTVAVVLRISYHVYYGAGATGVLIWASVFFWLYSRTRNLPALMAVHILWDLSDFLSQAWKGAVLIEFAVVAVILLIAPITWLVDYTSRPRPLPAQPYYPPSSPWSPSPQYPSGAGRPVPPWGAAPPWGAVPGPPQAAGQLSLAPPPGWYPDPSGSHSWRWWTGQSWTGHTNDLAR